MLCTPIFGQLRKFGQICLVNQRFNKYISFFPNFGRYISYMPEFGGASKDTINCPEKVIKISHYNQTNQGLLSILRQNSATFLSTNERQRYICFEGNVSIFLIGREAIRPMRDCNTLKSFPNPREDFFIVTLIQTKPNLMTLLPLTIDGVLAKI